jgi:flagellar biogenesis protein FliO
MIDILSTRHLGPKNSFLLVEVLGQVLLVGVSAQEMSLWPPSPIRRRWTGSRPSTSPQGLRRRPIPWGATNPC